MNPLLVALALAAASPFPNLGDPFAEFLPVEQAFQADARALDAGRVSVRWIATDGYYLYRDQFSFRIVDAPGVSLGPAELPAGEIKTDEFFGTVEVYYGEIEAILPVFREDTGTMDVTLELGYQGCADAGLCYPPDTRLLSVRLPGGSGAPPAAGFVSEQDRLAELLAGGELLWIVLTFYGLGLLLTFTPCVLPMVPILSGIILGQGPGLTARRGFALSLVYVLAMTAAYTAAGVLAARAGQNLQAWFQQPWVLVAFAAVFVALALAMFGLFRFEMPGAVQTRLAAWSNRQRGGSWAGVAVMGVLSALIVGPCVAAPLAGALIYIARSGDALLGGAALFAMGLGMGTLLLVIGATAGRWLPKAGPWMGAVRAAFGVLMLAVAVWLLERILPAALALALWAALAIGSAVYLGAVDALPPTASGWRRLWKGVGFALFAWGLLLLVGAASGGKDPLRPLAGSALFPGETRAELPFRPIKTVADLERELAAAGAAGRTVMLDFYADWCVSCKQMERGTFTDPRVQAALADTVWLQADVTRNDADDQALMRRFGILGPPSIVFYDRAGRELKQYRTVGFVPPAEFAGMLEQALR